MPKHLPSAAVWVWVTVALSVLWLTGHHVITPQPSQGSARLISVEQVPEAGACRMPAGASSEHTSLFAEFEATAYAADTFDVTRPPVRTIKDTYPIYSSVAVDPVRDEVILQDTNLFGIKIFNRTDNTPANSESTTPKRVIQGDATHCEYNNGLLLTRRPETFIRSPWTPKIMLSSSRAAPPAMSLRRESSRLPIRISRRVSMMRSANFISPSSTLPKLWFQEDASGNDQPIRMLEGPHTYLHDTHGFGVGPEEEADVRGHLGQFERSQCGRLREVFTRLRSTCTRWSRAATRLPCGLFKAPKTLLDWAGGITLDPHTGNIWVANDVGRHILVFKGTDEGDVVPTQIIGGPQTGLNHPTGISFDAKNREVWVSNMGNSSALAFSPDANGDVAPLRTIRSAPAGRSSVKFGKPQAVAFDSKRDLYLVPN